MREAKKAALQKLIELSSQRLEDVEIIGLITTDFGPVSSGDGLLAVGAEGGFPVPNSPPLYEFWPNPGNADRLRMDRDESKGEHVNLQTTDKRKQKTSHFYSFEPRPASEFDKRGKYIRLLPPQANVGMSKSTAEQAAATLCGCNYNSARNLGEFGGGEYATKEEDRKGYEIWQGFMGWRVWAGLSKVQVVDDRLYFGTGIDWNADGNGVRVPGLFPGSQG
ncbi:hypothetical protein F5882DRAFT_444217 [Hyaloscypha sp. PMI_1271]|nr:hypothetical protein F5882DRAFT_444217 [Hyaloscypha sp. PMI_1271]